MIEINIWFPGLLGEKYFSMISTRTVSHTKILCLNIISMWTDYNIKT